MDWPTATLLIVFMGFALFLFVILLFYKFIAWVLRSATKTTKKTVAVFTYPMKK